MIKRKTACRLSALAASIAMIASLASCSLPSGGETASRADRRLQRVEGIEDASISTEGTRHWFVDPVATVYVSVTLAEGYSVTDEEVFLNFLARVGWSVNDLEPKRSIAIFIYSPERKGPAWNRVAHEAGWTTTVGDDEEFVSIDPSMARQRLGGWPGAVPVIPPGLLVGEAPEATPADTDQPHD